MIPENSLLYEFPCNEKYRTYLRLEALFKRFDWFCEQDSPISHQAAISALFDLLDATARSDLRHELIQELERQRQRMLVKAAEPVKEDEEPVDMELLAKLESTITLVTNTVGRTGQSVRENQWLQLVRTRQTIVGGTCEFDLPQFHHWMNRDPSRRRSELLGYGATLQPIRDGSKILLDLLRKNVRIKMYRCEKGNFQQSMTHCPNVPLVQIWLPNDSDIIPELSVNKFMLWVRFSELDCENKPHPIREGALSFSMGMCSFD